MVPEPTRSPSPSGRAAVRLLRHPVLQFLVVAGLTLAAIAWFTSDLAGRKAEEQVRSNARETTRLLAKDVIEPAIRGTGDTLQNGIETGRRPLQDAVKPLVRDSNIARVAVWKSNGEARFYRGNPDFESLGDAEREAVRRASPGVVRKREDVDRKRGDGDTSARYEPQLGNDLTIGPGESKVLAAAEEGRRLVRAEQADPGSAVNREIAIFGGQSSENLLRTYTWIQDDVGNVLLFEVYYSNDTLASRSAELSSSFRWIGIGGLAFLVVIVTPMLFALTRRLTRAARERERLLQSALDASDRERRRIARDLHDGVVQDLAGTAFTVSAVARDRTLPPHAGDTLTGAAGSIRVSLRSLRSLLAEIHPPDLDAVGLPAALDDLTAPAQAAGVRATVNVTGVEDSSPQTTAVVWRVAQEAVRNTLRHAEASSLSIDVRREGDRVVLDVVDDGRGFDPDADPGRTHFGLTGIRSLVAECDGTLDVTSSPGSGTRVSMEVAAR